MVGAGVDGACSMRHALVCNPVHCARGWPHATNRARPSCQAHNFRERNKGKARPLPTAQHPPATRCVVSPSARPSARPHLL